VLAGCETTGLFDDGITYTGKVQVRQGIVMMDALTERLDLFTVRADSISRDVLYAPEEGEQIYDVFTGPLGSDSTTLFTLTYPVEDRQSDILASLTSIVLPGGTTARYETGSLFGEYRFSPDGRFLVLYHGMDDMSYSTSLFNPNEIAIIDLAAAPSETNPTIRSIDIQGHTIEDIFFLDPVAVGAVQRRLVAFVTDGLIQLADFADPDYSSITVRLKTLTDQRAIVVSHMDVRGAWGTFGPRIFAIAPGATEIYDIELVDAPDRAAGFDASLNLLDAGFRPDDFAVVEDGTSLLLVVVSGSVSAITIFEVDTSAATTILTEGGLTTLFRRDHIGGPELVMYGDYTNRIYLLPLTDIARHMGDDLDSIYVPDGIESISVLDDDRLLVHPYSGGGIIMADLRSRGLTHLYYTDSYSWGNAVLHDDTLFLSSESRISFLNISAGQPMELVLDEPITNFYVFAHSGVGMALHSTPTGRATLFPLDNPTRQACLIADGFYVKGILNGEEEQP